MHERMSKRKRHDSLSCTSKQIPENRINDGFSECLNDEVMLLPDNETVDGDDLKSKNDIESSNENVDPVNSSNGVNENSIVKDIKNDNFNLRRKSNRILSLKRSIVPSLQNCGSLNSPSNEDSILIQGSTGESSSTTNTNISTDSAKTILTNTDVSNTISSLAQTSQNKNATNNCAAPTTSTSGAGKSLRKIQAWTEDDTRWFFEALCEHGKDFPHIQTYIAARYEKKGIPSDMIKNYEQVRHYYYRMWHKISQMLKISNVVDKGVQEIYGLINYGEIWKKFGSKFDAKLNANLQQLVDYGYTVFKVKGKSVRVRTPICNALKKIHNINRKIINKPITPPIPKEITVELLPATNADWIHVHSLAQNPRLRTKLTMQHRLSTLIAYLERRWSLTRINENASNVLLNANIYEENDSISLKPIKSFAIRLKPQNSEKLCKHVQLKSTTNSISMNNYRSTTHGNAQIDLSLSSYLKNLLIEDSTLNEGKKAKIRKSSKKTIQTDAINNIMEDKIKDEIKTTTEDEVRKDEMPNNSNQPIDLLKMFDCMNEELEVSKNKTISMQPDKSSLDNFEMDLSETNNELDEKETNDLEDRDLNVDYMKLPPAHTTLAQWLAGGHSLESEKEDDVINDEENEDKIDGSEIISTSPNQNSSPVESKSKKRRGSIELGNNDLVNLLTSKQARLGWTLEDAQSVSIGELYLLFNCPIKIVLEYSWESKNENCNLSLNVEQSDKTGKINDLPQELDKTTRDSEPIIDEQLLRKTKERKSPVLNMLQKLLIAANITLSNLKRPIGSSSNSQTSTSNTGDTTIPSSGQQNKPIRKRIRKKVTPCPLLSNVIRDTILNDGSEEQTKSVNSNINEEIINVSSNPNKDVNVSSDVKEKDQFVAPKLPAPRSNQSQMLKSKYRTTADPVEVEQVLKELKAQKYRRQRRPLPKPYIYNLQNTVLPQNKMVQGKRSALLVIPASHITSAKGKTSPQILLTDLLTKRIPQTSLSLSPASTTSVTVASISSNQSHEQHSLATTSTVIPIQVDTKKVSQEMSLLTSQESFQQLNDSGNSITPMVISTESNNAEISPNTFKESNLASLLSQDAKIQSEESNINFSKEANTFEQDTSTNVSSISLTKPSTADVLTQSQLSWLNDVNNDLSLGSLIAACDIVANEELNTNQKVTNETSLAINADIETHMSSMANDNSIDLMAKFADLAAQITADTKNI